MQVRFPMSVLLKIKVQGKMMGALGVMNKIRPSILESSFTRLGSVVLLFLLPRLNALKQLPPPPPPPQGYLPTPHLQPMTLHPMFKRNKGCQCPKFSLTYLQIYYTFTYITYTHTNTFIYFPAISEVFSSF